MGVWGKVELEALYGRLEKPLYNVVYRLVWDREEARDLVQEAFVRLWAMRRRVRTEGAEPLAYRIAVNLARSRNRRARIRRMLSIESIAGRLFDPGNPEADLVADDRQLRVRRAIRALPPDVRNVVLLSTFGGLAYAEIGSVLGIPEGTVGSRRNRGLRLLRAALSETECDERAS